MDEYYYDDFSCDSEEEEEVFEEQEEEENCRNVEYNYKAIKENRDFLPERLKLYLDNISTADIIHACTKDDIFSLNCINNEFISDICVNVEEEQAIIKMIEFVKGSEAFMADFLYFLLYVHRIISRKIVTTLKAPIILPSPSVYVSKEKRKPIWHYVREKIQEQTNSTTKCESQAPTSWASLF